MKLTIFYSWQAKTNIKKNKNYISTCIEKACKKVEKKRKNINFEIQEGENNISGTPQIATLIMDERIPNCNIFIADLSVTDPYALYEKFFNKIKTKKRDVHQANNVMLEYGIAYKAIGSEVIIGVLNSEYGSPKENSDNIPFDIRHMRFPIEYQYNIEKNEFIAELAKAISECATTAIKQNREKFKPFITWNEFSEKSSNKSFFFENDTISSTKKRLVENKIIRFLGISGLGKTRITFEAFRSDDENMSLNYLYCDYQPIIETNILSTLDKLFSDVRNTQAIIIDNCPLLFFRKVLKMRCESNAINSIISIFNEPEETEIDKMTSVEYIKLSISDLESVVEQILKNHFLELKEEEKKIIMEFSEGIPLMAVLLEENLRNGNQNLGLLSDKELLDKLLSVEDKDDMELLKSCSIFRYIGFEGDIREHIELIITNKDITPISGENEEKINKFERLFSKYSKREIFEKNGRLFGIRPRPLAFYLATQWFETCDPTRLDRVFEFLQKLEEPIRRILIESISGQIIYLGDNPKVRVLISKILRENGPFDNAKVVNTELGSRLFRSFVEVNPISVADNLYRLFGSMPTEELRNIIEGRRNLVWALEKLCFYEATFEKGIKLMMSFATAENETWSNNASGEFLRLFRIIFPGTEVNLGKRLQIIEWGLKKGDDFKKMAIKAIGSALKTQHFSYFSGAEKQGLKNLEHYMPNSQEIREYWASVLELLQAEILQGDTDNYELCCNILVESVRGIIRKKSSDLILPIIEEVIAFRKNDWGEMLESLHFALKYDVNSEDKKTEEAISKNIKALTKTDFVSRFNATKKQFTLSNPNSSYIEQQARYKELAVEFVNEKCFSKDILKSLYSSEEYVFNPFGYTIAEMTRNDPEYTKLFINTSIEILNEIKEKYTLSIFIDYVRGLNMADATYLINLLFQESKLSHLLFQILAVRNTNLNDLSMLFSLIDDNPSMISRFETFFHYYIIKPEIEENIAGLLRKLKDYNSQGPEIAISIIFNILSFYKDFNLYPNVLNLAEEIIENTSLFNNNNKASPIDKWLQATKILLKESCRPKLAKYVNSEIIRIAGDATIYFFSNYDLKDLYSVLLSDKYFDVVWQDLSAALLYTGDEYQKFYDLQSLLGSRIGNTLNNENVLFKENNYKEIFDWCDSNPEIAPARLASMIPIYEQKKQAAILQEDKFHPLVISLLERYGDNFEMLNSLETNMDTFSWVGSEIPLLELKVKCFEKLLSHKNQKIVDWATKTIEHTQKEIASIQQREKENAFLYK
jgi:hypothetical protein